MPFPYWPEVVSAVDTQVYCKQCSLHSDSFYIAQPLVQYTTNLANLFLLIRWCKKRDTISHMPPQRTILRWSAYEHEHVPRGGDWFWALGIVAVSAALTSILFHDILFAILILIAAGILAMLANVPPDLVRFEISDRGVRVGDTMHRYEEILSFWVEEEHGDRPMLLVDTTKFMAPNLIIPLENIDPHVVRHYLRAHAEEVPMKEPLAHKILEFFGL